MLPGRRTADGALFVTQGPPPAGTPLVGGIAVRADGAGNNVWERGVFGWTEVQQ